MDAAPTESEVRPVAISPPRAPTIDYKRLFERILPIAAGVGILLGDMNTPPSFSFAESKSPSHSTALSEPLTHPNLSEVEQETLKSSVAEELKTMKNDQERIERSLSWKNMLEQIVADARLNIPDNERPFWIKTMLEITFVESGGNPKANSGIAFGLTQLQVTTAKEIADQYKIPAYDLFNGWDNLFLGTAHQLNMAKLYGKDLGPWIHHLGMGNATKAIITYLSSVEKLPVSEIDKIFLDETNQLLSKYIAEYQITPTKLLRSPAVSGMLKAENAFNDDTGFYDARLKASGQAMSIA